MPDILTKSGKVLDNNLERIKNFILSANVFQFKDEYVGSKNFMDLSSKKLKIKIGNKVKEIVISTSEIPPELRRIIDRIEKIKSSLD